MFPPPCDPQIRQCSAYKHSDRSGLQGLRRADNPRSFAELPGRKSASNPCLYATLDDLTRLIDEQAVSYKLSGQKGLISFDERHDSLATGA